MTESPGERVLAGDIGGTKTLLAMFGVRAGELASMGEQAYASRAHATFGEILDDFASRLGGIAPRALCLAAAGPVIDGRCHTTNLPWLLDERDIATRAGTPRVKLLNDLEATAYGMLHLAPEEIATLNPGRRPSRPGNVAVIAAGTGLGEAMLVWDGAQHHPIASEGGHADFAPRNDLETDLLRHLRRKLGGRVSYERVLSGPGLFEIYLFLRQRDGSPEPAWLAAAVSSGDPSAAVSSAGLEHRDAVAAAALELFCELYGAEAGNMALRGVTVGGVYLGGGIAPKILPALQGGAFVRGFTDKGRFADFVRAIEVRVSLNPRAALLGSAHYALRL